ncbi:hypothetical protein AYK20_05410 [Thermoplasmatales archaeon SG8-52-1]|nr:MAG: hypothetical protein AYK20_05410 [Thermoplasmatales archaeon SG8-52-1]
MVDDKSLKAKTKEKNESKRWSFGKSFFNKKKSAEEEVIDSNQKNTAIESEVENASFEDKNIKNKLKDKKKIGEGKFGKSFFKIKKSTDVDNINFDKKGTFFKYDNLEDLVPISIEKKDDLESKADDLAKKHGFFKNDKIGQIDEKKNEKNLSFDDFDLNKQDKSDEIKNEILDEKIKEFPIIDESDIKDVLPEAVEPKSKIFF